MTGMTIPSSEDVDGGADLIVEWPNVSDDGMANACCMGGWGKVHSGENKKRKNFIYTLRIVPPAAQPQSFPV